MDNERGADGECGLFVTIFNGPFDLDPSDDEPLSWSGERKGGSMSDSSTESATPPAASPHDFDFLFGSWRIHNRRLDDPFGDSGSWREFEAHSEAYPILRRLGNVQIFDAPEFPGRPAFQGYALRLLDPEEEVWRIWWASTGGGGRLDSPVLGRFRDGVGQFDGKDVIDGREIGVRFLWTEITETSAHWEQSFSFDGGKTFVPNWIMLHERVGGPR